MGIKELPQGLLPATTRLNSEFVIHVSAKKQSPKQNKIAVWKMSITTHTMVQLPTLKSHTLKKSQSTKAFPAVQICISNTSSGTNVAILNRNPSTQGLYTAEQELQKLSCAF